VVAFISASSFGDSDGSDALLFRDGTITQVTPGEALRLLGVKAKPGEDEFDTLGLGRNTRRWMETLAAPARPQTLPELVTTFRSHSDYGVRLEAAHAMCATGPAGILAALELVPLAAVGSPASIGDRAALLQALRMRGSLPSSSAPLFISLLEDPDARCDAVLILGSLGAGAAGAVERLREIERDDPQTFIRSHATEALKAIGESAAEPIERLPAQSPAASSDEE
jgi:HEAT repeat protein